MKIIKIGADWCAPCRLADAQLAPQLESLGVSYIKEDAGPRMVNMEELQRKYPLIENIKGIPIFLYEKDNKVKILKVGYNTSLIKEIKALWNL